MIFGDNSMNDMKDIYDLLHKKIHECHKPLYPILPSITSSSKELWYFLNKGNINFPDEVVLEGHLLKYSTLFHLQRRRYSWKTLIFHLSGRLSMIPLMVISNLPIIQKLLTAVNIPVVKEEVASSKRELISLAKKTGYMVGFKGCGTCS